MYTNELNPTLWRSCRVLANKLRLEILYMLFKHPGSCVSDVGAFLKIEPVQATKNLRALNARGLLQAERRGRFVYYRPEHNPSIPETKVILAVLKQDRNPHQRSILNKIHSFTAFTHPRRIAIAQALHNEDMTFSNLCRATQISRPAAKRHLDKLLDRGFVKKEDDVYLIHYPGNALGDCLLNIAVNERQPS